MPDDAVDTIIYFSAPIQSHYCRALIELMSGAVKNGIEDVHLFMNSGGGDVNNGIALYHALRAFPVRLSTYNMSIIGSMAVPVFLAGEQRFALKHSSFFVHETTMMERNEWQLRTAKFLVDGIEESEGRMVSIIAERTGQPERTVQEWASGVRRFDPDEALDVGIIDDFGEIEIAKPHTIDFVLE